MHGIIDNPVQWNHCAFDLVYLLKQVISTILSISGHDNNASDFLSALLVVRIFRILRIGKLKVGELISSETGSTERAATSMNAGGIAMF